MEKHKEKNKMNIPRKEIIDEIINLTPTEREIHMANRIYLDLLLENESWINSLDESSKSVKIKLGELIDLTEKDEIELIVNDNPEFKYPISETMILYQTIGRLVCTGI